MRKMLGEVNSPECAALHNPASALGFLFYGAAAVAYSRAGLDQPAEIYDRLAREELQAALASLREAAVENEAHPVRIRWNC